MNKEEIKNLIKDLIEKVKIKIKGIQIEEESQKNTWFRVEVDEPEHFIGRDGEALTALNHIVRRMIEARIPEEEKYNNPEALRILIDINDFQKKKIDGVRTVAHMMSERARYFKSNIEVDPMSSFERRIVHEFLADALDLKTESVGMGPQRRVVIKYVGEI